MKLSQNDMEELQQLRKQLQPILSQKHVSLLHRVERAINAAGTSMTLAAMPAKKENHKTRVQKYL